MLIFSSKYLKLMKKTMLFMLLSAFAFSLTAQDGFVGEIRLFAGTYAPKNWAFCDGQLFSVNQNTALFTILGNMYGGDGRSTFALPNLGGLPLEDLEHQDAISKGDGQPVTFTAQNMSGAPVDMYWVDFTGERKPYAKIQSGASVRQDSASGHVWLFMQGETLLEAINLNTQAGQQFTIKPRATPRYIICVNGSFPARN
jgi:microcystin-dependent protein